MSEATGMDVRLPIGVLFVVLGAVLVVFGAATAGDATRYAPSLGININLWWGLVMLAFGIVLFLMHRVGAARDRAAAAAAAGRPAAQR